LSESNSERRLDKTDTENIPADCKGENFPNFLSILFLISSFPNVSENNPKTLKEAAGEVANEILNNTTSTPKAPIASKNAAFTFDLQKTAEKKTSINRVLCLNSPRNDSLGFLTDNFNNLGLGKNGEFCLILWILEGGKI
jgi:hypothetical protein